MEGFFFFLFYFPLSLHPKTKTMKKLLLLLAVSVAFVSCKKEQEDCYECQTFFEQHSGISTIKTDVIGTRVECGKTQSDIDLLVESSTIESENTIGKYKQFIECKLKN